MTKWIVAILVICISCDNSPKKNTLSREDFSYVAPLRGKIIPVKLPKFALYCNIIQDSLLFVTNQKPSPYYIEVINLNTNKTVTQFAKRGEAPGELLSCELTYKNVADNYFVVHDITKQVFWRYSVDSVLLQGDKYLPSPVYAPQGSKDLLIVSEDSAVAYNSYYFKNSEFNNSATPYFNLKLSNSRSKNDSIFGNLKYKFYTDNVSGGFVMKRKSSDTIWIAHHHKDLLEAYVNGSSVMTIKGPDNFDPKYILKENDHVSFAPNTYYRSYLSDFSTASGFYLTYIRVNGDLNDYRKPVEIFKFDWQGNLQTRYQLDRFLYTLSVDDKGKYLYGTTSTDFGENVRVVKYELD